MPPALRFNPASASRSSPTGRAVGSGEFGPRAGRAPAVATCLSIEALAARPIVAAPPEVLAALESADAGILCVQPQEGELTARTRHRRRHRAQEDPLRAHGRRDAPHHVRGHAGRLPSRRSPQPAAVRPHAVGAAVDGSDGGGTNFTRRSILAGVGQDERPDQPRYWSNLPAGEAFTTPASVDGTFVCDGTAGDYFNAKYGTLDVTPWCSRFAAVG